MNFMPDLELDLEQDCRNIYKKSDVELGYKPTILMQLISNSSKGVKLAVMDIINNPYPSKAFEFYRENKHLEMTLEALIYENEKYHKLVGNDTVLNAKKRLSQVGYFKQS